MSIKEMLKILVEKEGSDLFYRAGGKPRARIDGKLEIISEKNLTVEDVTRAVEELTNEHQRKLFKDNLDLDFAIYLEEFKRRFRVSIFMQRNWPAMVIRNVRSTIQSFEELGLPADILKKLSLEKRGLVLLTGSAGSGKSTTLAAMIEYMNNNARKHILTVEEPIEFTFKDNLCTVNQRELGLDVSTYEVALRAFTLQSPDVIFIGNIRDAETMAAAITAAETGVLVLSTLHTVNAPQTIERIVNFFPPHQHPEMRQQLSMLLKGVISLRLLPKKGAPGRVPAYEAMLLTPTVSRLIREAKTHEIPRFIEEGAIFGMQSFNQSLSKLVKDGLVAEDAALEFSDNADEFSLVLKGIKRP